MHNLPIDCQNELDTLPWKHDKIDNTTKRKLPFQYTFVLYTRGLQNYNFHETILLKDQNDFLWINDI